MIAMISSAAPAADVSTTRDVQNNDDNAAQQQFAGVFANAMNAQAPKPAPQAKKPDDATSDLDGNDDADTTDAAPGSGRNATSGTSATTDTSAADIARSIALLNPMLQSKLARVISRVQAETGHTVSVAETYRSQSRQNTLYAQGRDTAGPVVTWTKSSKHTEGRAVDLVLDGGKASGGAYAQLQRIANEEGLHTLGARDPGHLELPGSAGAVPSDAANADLKSFLTMKVHDTSNAALATPTEPADASGQGQVPVARLAQFAQIQKFAQVAPTAQVARIARVADVQGPAQVAGVARPGAVAKPGSAATLTMRVVGASSDKSSSSNDTSDAGTQGDSRGGYSAFGSSARNQFDTGFTLPDVAPAASTSSAARAEQVMTAIDNAPIRPLSQITMQVDAGNGATDRVQVAMRGTSVATTIDASDPRAAQAMTVRGDELVKALAGKGLDTDSLRIRSATTNSTGTLTATAAAGSSNAQQSTDSSSQSRYQRGDAWQQQQERQERQRSQQRSQQDRRNQQREPRGGK